MTKTVDVWFNGNPVEAEAYVVNTESGINIEFVDLPIVVDYREDE